MLICGVREVGPTLNIKLWKNYLLWLEKIVDEPLPLL